MGSDQNIFGLEVEENRARDSVGMNDCVVVCESEET